MTNAPRRPGRPPGNKTLRYFRSMTWYLAVRSKEGLNDSKLDIMFGTGEGEDERNSADRIKIFEAIRVNGSIPSNGDSGKRNFDLVARVNARKGYEGTSGIIHSPFWRLLDSKQMTLSEIRETVIACISLLDLACEEGDYEDDGRNDLVDLATNNPELTIEEYFRYQREGDDGYDNAMASAFLHLRPTLDYIALLGALSFESIAAGNMKIASDQVRFFTVLLREYCDQPWISKIGEQLYQYAVKRMLETLNIDALNGLPSYTQMLSNIPGVNLGSPAAAFLIRHQRLLWRK